MGGLARAGTHAQAMRASRMCIHRYVNLPYIYRLHPAEKDSVCLVRQWARGGCMSGVVPCTLLCQGHRRLERPLTHPCRATLADHYMQLAICSEGRHPFPPRPVLADLCKMRVQMLADIRETGKALGYLLLGGSVVMDVRSGQVGGAVRVAHGAAWGPIAHMDNRRSGMTDSRAWKGEVMRHRPQ